MADLGDIYNNLKKKKNNSELGLVAHACNPSTQNVEVGGGVYSDHPSYIVDSMSTCPAQESINPFPPKNYPR